MDVLLSNNWIQYGFASLCVFLVIVFVFIFIKLLDIMKSTNTTIVECTKALIQLTSKIENNIDISKECYKKAEDLYIKTISRPCILKKED